MKSPPARRLRTKTSEMELLKLQTQVNGRVQPSAPAQEKEQLPKPGTLPTPAVQEHKQFSLVEVSSEEGRQAALKCHMGTGTFVREEGFVKERLWNFEVHRCRSFLLTSDQACLAAVTLRVNPYIGWRKSWVQVANMSAAQERRGYGRMLFRAVEELLLREGVDVLALYPAAWPQAPNGKAPKFWSAMGFHEADGSFLPPEELVPFNHGGPLWPEVTGATPLARFEKRIAAADAVRRSPSELRFGDLIGKNRPHIWQEEMWRPNGCVNMAAVNLDVLPPPITSPPPPKATPQPKVKAERAPKPLPPRRQQPPRACKPVREEPPKPTPQPKVKAERVLPPRRQQPPRACKREEPPAPPKRAAPAPTAPTAPIERAKQRVAPSVTGAVAVAPAPPTGPRARAAARAPTQSLPAPPQTTPVQRTRAPRVQISAPELVTPQSLPKRKADALTPAPVCHTPVLGLLGSQSLLKRRRVQ
ncbi:unnamed protein product [Effrenium voratum]|nr:unnamed protein product [Effrenium voratum]